MPATNRRFDPLDYPEVFRPEDTRAAQRAVARGELRRLLRGLYTWNVDSPVEQLTRRRWRDITESLFPGAVIVDRTAVEAKPADDGSVIIDAGPSYTTAKAIRLPGLVIRPRKGPGPLPGDMPFGELFLSSPARQALENLRPSRARSGVARTLSREELETWLERLAATRGEDELLRLRDEARELAPAVGDVDFATLDRLIGALLGTRESTLLTSAGQARRRGLPFDTARLQLLEELRGTLAGTPQPRRPAPADPEHALAFYEAYFSNFIEGTEFEVEEAEEIVFEGRLPVERPQDAHDVIGTYQLIIDGRDRTATPHDADELLELLQRFNRRILEDRPEAAPGRFKERPNRAGGTVFVRPELVQGTLRAAWEMYDTLPGGFARAAFAMVLTAEVHPFADGNGRTARALMNSELSAAGECRILIPIAYREDYLGALRRFSRERDTITVQRMLDRAQRWVSLVDWSTREGARGQLEATNALASPDSGLVLRDP